MTTHTDTTRRTTIVYYRVNDGAQWHHYQGIYLRSHYHGARPGDLVPQVTFVGYVCHIAPGSRLEPVCEMREPRATQEEVEAEARRFLAARHERTMPDVEETARHAFVAGA